MKNSGKVWFQWRKDFFERLFGSQFYGSGDQYCGIGSQSVKKLIFYCIYFPLQWLVYSKTDPVLRKNQKPVRQYEKELLSPG